MKNLKYLHLLIGSLSLISACDSEIVLQGLDVTDKALAQRQQAILVALPSRVTLYNDVLKAVASIMIIDHPDYSDQTICSGTLISSHHILTAAHCVAELSNLLALYSEDSSDPNCKWRAERVSSRATSNLNYLKVGFGNKKRDLSENMYDIKSVVYHTGYAYVANSIKCNDNHFDGYEYSINDIAIIELASDVPKELAQPISILPPWLAIKQTELDGASNTIMGDRMIFAGYGYDLKGRKGNKSWVLLPVSSYCDPDQNEFCPYGEKMHIEGCHPYEATCLKTGYLDYYDEYVASPSKSYFYTQKPVGLMDSQGPCNGDSGGPAINYVGNKPYVVGITSYGDKACKNYGVSTAVHDYYDWIVKNAPEVQDGIKEVCNNFLDDDNNGLTDQFDPACEGLPYCGDGIVSEGEACDGEYYYSGSDECYDWNYKYESGKLSCDSHCRVIEDACVEAAIPDTCGNGFLDAGEQCDGTQFADMYKQPMSSNSCYDFSILFSSGELSCYDNCRVNVDNCTLAIDDPYERCGNGVIDPGESCDGHTFPDGMPLKCRDYDSSYSGGNIKCNAKCEIDYNDCVMLNLCGDGIVSGEELCDGNQFLWDTNLCLDWSVQFSSGLARCNSNCTTDYSMCALTQDAASKCGNGVLDKSSDAGDLDVVYEECDGDLYLKGQDCHSWDERFNSGKVSCNANCTLNYSDCKLDDVFVVHEDEYAIQPVLDSCVKPEVWVPIKASDSARFYPNRYPQSESLKFETHKEAEDQNSNDQEKDDQQQIEPIPDPVLDEVPSERKKSSSCSAAPMSPTNPNLLYWVFGGVILGLAVRRRKQL